METSVTYDNHQHHQESLLNQPGTSNGHLTFQTSQQQELHNHYQSHITNNNHHHHQQEQQQQQQQVFLSQNRLNTPPLTAVVPASVLGIDNNPSLISDTVTTNSATSNSFAQLNIPPLPIPDQAQQYQNPYQFKCSLLEHHLHEAYLINKALKSEVQQYREKIEFEKKLRSALIDRVNNFNTTG